MSGLSRIPIHKMCFQRQCSLGKGGLNSNHSAKWKEHTQLAIQSRGYSLNTFSALEILSVCSRFRCFFNFLLNFLRLHWLIKLYRLQVYNSIIHHPYIILHAHHPKSSLLPSPFIRPFIFYLPHPLFLLVITILLSVSMRLFFS